MTDAALTPPHVIRVGNPSVHEARTEAGEVIGHEPRPDLGAQVTEVHLPLDAHLPGDGKGPATTLASNVDEIAGALEGASRESFLVHLLTSEGLTAWETALSHLYVVVSHHAREGIDWVACEDTRLQAVLANIFNAEQGERPGYGQPDPNAPALATPAADLPTIAGGSPE